MPPHKMPRRKKTAAPPIPKPNNGDQPIIITTAAAATDNDAAASTTTTTSNNNNNRTTISTAVRPDEEQPIIINNAAPSPHQRPPAAAAAVAVGVANNCLPLPSLRRQPHGPSHTPIASLQTTYPRDYQRLCAAVQPIWRPIAERMQFTGDEIAHRIPVLAVQFDLSEAAVLLAIWGDQLNHTLTELFVLLAHAKRPAVMLQMRHLVPPEYHRLVPQQQQQPAVANAPPLSAFSDEENATPSPQMHEINASKTPPAATGTPGGQPAPAPRPSAAAAASDSTASDSTASDVVIGQLASHIPRIAFDELTRATRNWSEEHVLGAGGFGTVYYGRWKNTAVAIKRIKTAAPTAAAVLEQQQGWNELRHLNACRHDNILPLYGFSVAPGAAPGGPCLVYKLMTGGSLEYRLFGKAPTVLQWFERMRIAIGTAR